MLRIRGSEQNREYKHALAFEALILERMPDAKESPDCDIHIFVPLRTPGQKRTDIDLGLLATFAVPLVHNDAAGNPVFIHAICATIEVKDTPFIDFENDTITVHYTDEHGNTTSDDVANQSEEQKWSLYNYLKGRRLWVPRITNFAWLRQKNRSAIPDRYLNMLPAELDFNEFLDRLLLANNRREPGNKFQSNDVVVVRKAVREITDTPPQTRLDRERIDRLTAASIRREWFADVGHKQITLEGRGGCGKTFALLDRAVKLSGESGKRVLMLTFNHALAADIQRQIMILEQRGVKVRIDVKGVNSFLMQVAANWGFTVPKSGAFEPAYRSALQFFRTFLLEQEDAREVLRSYMSSNHTDFIYDFIFIDEGQDWYEEERDILHLMYPPQAFIIAIGADQLVRQRRPCDWTRDVPLDLRRKAVSLTKCLRMGSSLAMFVNEFAKEMNVDSWKIKEAAELAGGRIVIVEGDMLSQPALFSTFLNEMLAFKNAPIDMLVCVPPYLRRPSGTMSSEDVVQLLGSWKHEIWDGTDPQMRRIVPWKPEQIRVVQYPSSRGLEGFTVVNLGLDDFYDWKLSEGNEDDEDFPPLLPEVVAQNARRFAAGYTVIPLTRAMNTLVLNVRSRQSDLGSVLHDLSTRVEGVEWMKIR